MAMSRLEMQGEVRANLDRTVGGLASGRINVWLNWAQERIADYWTFEEMRKKFAGSVTAAGNSYGFPTNMKDIYSMKVFDGSRSRALVYVPAREFDQKVPEIDVYATDIPEWYVDYGVNFEVFPKPNQTYDVELRCSLYPEDFASDTAVSQLIRKDKLIICAATVYGFYSLREYKEGDYWSKEIFTAMLAESENTDHSGEDWTPVARPFSGGGMGRYGEVAAQFWKSPFVGRRL